MQRGLGNAGQLWASSQQWRVWKKLFFRNVIPWVGLGLLVFPGSMLGKGTTHC